MNKRRGLALVETVGSMTWFAMDACWMLGGEVAEATALVLALPTIGLALSAVYCSPRRWAAWLVAGATTAWACMNVVWMAHDFHVLSWGMGAAKAFFLLGVALIGLAFLLSRRIAVGALVVRLRRLRLRV